MSFKITRDASGKAGFSFDGISMKIKKIEPWAQKFGPLWVGGKIVKVDGIPVANATQYAKLAKPKHIFILTLLNEDSSSAVPRWEWQDNDKSWKLFSPKDAAVVENAYRSKISITLYPVPGRSYVVNTSLMTQKNTKTGYSRSIRRNGVSAGGFGSGSAYGRFGNASGFPRSVPTPNVGGNSSSTTISVPGAPLTRTTITFTSKSRDQLDIGRLTGMNRVYPPLYDPVKDTDPIFFEPLGDGKSKEVVEIRCSTPQLRCVFIKDSLVQSVLNGASKCPVCKTRFKIPGPQPSGTLKLSLSTAKCAGFPSCGSIVLQYNFPGGTQGPQHYHPGQSYAGTSRTAYLPDNAEGRESMGLLIKAFESGILFRVGQSITTSSHNQTVWGSVHQKTAYTGGTSAHGWPDDTYFSRVVSECAACGVFSDKWEENRRQEREKHRIARQISAEKKRKAAASGGGGAKEHTGPDPSAAVDNTVSVDTSEIDAEIKRIETNLTRINKDMQVAMRNQNRSKIASLMGKRRKLRESLTALEAKKKNTESKMVASGSVEVASGSDEVAHKTTEPDDSAVIAAVDSSATEAAVEELSETMKKINKKMREAMAKQDRTAIMSLMKERSGIQTRLTKLQAKLS